MRGSKKQGSRGNLWGLSVGQGRARKKDTRDWSRSEVRCTPRTSSIVVSRRTQTRDEVPEKVWEPDDLKSVEESMTLSLGRTGEKRMLGCKIRKGRKPAVCGSKTHIDRIQKIIQKDQRNHVTVNSLSHWKIRTKKKKDTSRKEGGNRHIS